MSKINKIDIIAACSDLGVHIDGSSFGPITLLNSINDCNINNIKFVNITDKNYKKSQIKNDLKKNLDQINLFNSELYKTVSDSLLDNCFPITLGGDHSIAIGSSLASIKKYNNLGIIWFDAHGDYHTFKTTISGNIHGLPLASITNFEKTLLKDFHSGNCYNPLNTVLLGGRDIDLPDELKNLKNAGVTIITTDEIHKYGIDEMAKKAFDIALKNTNGLHISYDIDVIDPILAPGVSVPAQNGINLEEAYGFVEYIIKNKEKIKSLDIVEFNPLMDINKKTEKIVLNILNKLIDKL